MKCSVQKSLQQFCVCFLVFACFKYVIRLHRSHQIRKKNHWPSTYHKHLVLMNHVQKSRQENSTHRETLLFVKDEMRYTKIMKAACLTTCISQQRLPGEDRIKKEQFMSCLPVSTHSQCCFTRRKVLRWTRQAGAVTALLNWSLNLLFIPNSASSPCFLLLASCRRFAPWLPTPLSSNPQLVHSNWDALPFLLVFPH